MKHSSIIVFIGIVLTIYAGLNFYYIRRSAQALCGLGFTRTIVISLLISGALAFPIGRIAETCIRNSLTHVLIVAGSMYLGFFFYAVLAAFVADIIRLSQYFFHFIPSGLFENHTRSLHVLWFSLAGIITAALGIGFAMDSNPRIKTYEIKIPKKTSPWDALTIAAVSDIHFGAVLGKTHLLKIKTLVKQIKPDMILLLGDLFDEKVPDEERVQMTAFLKDLTCPRGTFAIIGNHDYFSGLPKVQKVLEQANVTLLQDSSLTINDALVLVGRKDRSAQHMGDTRKSLGEILGAGERKLPIILMDHQPFHLEEAQKNGIDLQLSGHTHHGQLFPMNLLYKWIYETSWGYLRKGNTQYIVSCGAGTWGPPVRTNSISEVMKIRLIFSDTE
jgi:predicted MPP superfamily phosphohydrolase